MAIILSTAGTKNLRLPANLTRGRIYNTAVSIDGVSTQYGYWRARFVQLPTTYQGPTTPTIDGADLTNAGTSAGSNDYFLRVNSDSNATAAMRRRPEVRLASNGQSSFLRLPDTGAGSAMASNVPYLVIEGLTNISTTTTPVWVFWLAMCQAGTGTVYLTMMDAAGGLSAGLTTNSNGGIAGQVFEYQGPSSTRSIAGTIVQHLAFANGNFPWDTANNRPHFDAIAALAGAPGIVPHTYASLVAAQNAGTLASGGGYADLRAGKSDLDYWWRLDDMSALDNWTGAQSAGANLFGQEVAGILYAIPITGSEILDTATIAPAHWAPNVQPIVNAPPVRFHGGAGSRALVVSGTYGGVTTALQRRWIVESTGVPVGGASSPFDWSNIAGIGSGNWNISDTLPVGGKYTLQVRDTNEPGNMVSSTGWMVGTVMLVHAQSGSHYTFASTSSGGVTTNVNGQNLTSTALAAGVVGMVVRLSNAYGGAPAAYAQPTPVLVELMGGTGGVIPAVGQGTVTCINEWHAEKPGHPLFIVNMALEGTNMNNWAANTSLTVMEANRGHASWFFLGTMGAVAGPSSGNNSGIAETLAALIGRYVDVHFLMWTPGMAVDEATRTAYRAAIDALFSANIFSWWAVAPPWRGHRNPDDTSATVLKREEHLLFVAECGARGVLLPQWLDTVMSSNGDLHAAFQADRDANMLGVSRIGAGVGRSLAWVYDRTVKAHGPRLVSAWSDNGRATVNVELGRVCRTLNGAALDASQFYVSTSNPPSFVTTGFTAALDSTGTRVILTPADGGVAWAAAGSNLRIDYARNWPFWPAINATETNTERLLDGILYDDQTYRGGGAGITVGPLAGNPLQGTNRTGAGVAGIPVTARGAAKLVATERWTGTRNVTVQMVAADGVTVLREKTLAITGS